MHSVTDSLALSAYPPAPWKLSGSSVQALCLMPIARIGTLIPPEARIVPVLPGRTLAALYCAEYRPPSALCYHELAVAPALIRARGRIGFWISHIYVDLPASMHAGRDIWGLPKQLAAFHSSGPEEMTVTQDGRNLCNICWSSGAWSVPLPLLLPVVSRRGSHLQRFTASGRCATGLRSGRIAIDAGAPLEMREFQNVRRLFVARHLSLHVSPPRALSAPVA